MAPVSGTPQIHSPAVVAAMIVAARERLGLTQLALSERAGCSRQVVIDLEQRGEIPGSLRTLVGIELATGVPLVATARRCAEELILARQAIGTPAETVDA